MKTFESLLNLALWLAGVGHFCLLIASCQVPHQLGWKDDLAKLTPFNRKLMWVYGGFTLPTIVAFGAMTLLLHNEFLQRDRAAVVLAAFIAVYWTCRILVDFFYYEHADWPGGFRFVIGHFFLTALFIALAGTYWAALIWYFIK
jgi:RsiW-degrading membrane proteinase PrsW (M82 family)